MKQKFLVLLAVVLLSCASAFAQSGNNNPLKGDVNEDGQVDVADIAAVIDIMKNGGGTTDGKLYFYVGTEKPTSLSQATIVNSYPAEQTYTNNSGKKSHIFVLTNSDKAVTFINPELDAPVSQVDVDKTTISGYNIYETAVGTANNQSIIIRITDAPVYYYYAGWTLPTVDNVNEIINEEYPAESGSTVMHKAGKKTTSKSEMSYTDNTLYNANAKVAYYVLVPPTQTIVDPEDNSSVLSVFTSQGTITVGNLTHTVYKYNGTSRNINAIKIY